MRILITNDDGITSQGIKELATSLTSIGKVYVIAPETEKSACGHGITVHYPIKVTKFPLDENIEAWSVTGTPADCVKLGITTLLPQPPDMVVSGINNGANLGTDVLYSGTVSGAIEGIILGVPAMAVSIDSYTPGDYTLAKEVALKLCTKMLLEDLTPDTLINVNVPNTTPQEVKGIKVTRLGERKYTDNFEHRKDPRGNDYYWLKGKAMPPSQKDEDFDVVAVYNNFISVTPIHFDLTNYKIIEQVRNWGIEGKGF
ncbi:MAG: 5'/3'-nucleotidase SurE [Bacillota bacterium]